MKYCASIYCWHEYRVLEYCQHRADRQVVATNRTSTSAYADSQPRGSARVAVLWYPCCCSCFLCQCLRDAGASACAPSPRSGLLNNGLWMIWTTAPATQIPVSMHVSFLRSPCNTFLFFCVCVVCCYHHHHCMCAYLRPQQSDLLCDARCCSLPAGPSPKKQKKALVAAHRCDHCC